MELVCHEERLVCNPRVSLVAKNIKELVLQLKTVTEQQDDYQTFQVDLSQSESIDSIGITFLIGLYKTLSARGKRFELSGVSEPMMQLFKIMKLDELFNFTNL